MYLPSWSLSLTDFSFNSWYSSATYYICLYLLLLLCLSPKCHIQLDISTWMTNRYLKHVQIIASIFLPQIPLFLQYSLSQLVKILFFHLANQKSWFPFLSYPISKLPANSDFSPSPLLAQYCEAPSLLVWIMVTASLRLLCCSLNMPAFSPLRVVSICFLFLSLEYSFHRHAND